jgi:hypothetical protein
MLFVCDSQLIIISIPKKGLNAKNTKIQKRGKIPKGENTKKGENYLTTKKLENTKKGGND